MRCWVLMPVEAMLLKGDDGEELRVERGGDAVRADGGGVPSEEGGGAGPAGAVVEDALVGPVVGGVVEVAGAGGLDWENADRGKRRPALRRSCSKHLRFSRSGWGSSHRGRRRDHRGRWSIGGPPSRVPRYRG